MFLEYKKDKNALRFVYDPKNQHDKEYISKVNSKIEEESDRRETTEICGVVLVPKEVKASVDSVFQKLVTVELEFELGVTYGHIVETVFRNMCNIDRCQKPCLHDYDGRHRIWAHEIYHKLIEEFSNQRSMKRKDFVKNLRDYDSFQFLKKYDIDSLKKPKIMTRKEGMDFVVTSLFRSVGHLNMAEIEEEDFDLLNKSLFKDCKAGVRHGTCLLC